MKRMSGSDAVFLYGESAGVHGHSLAVLRLDPGTVTAPVLASRIRSLLHRRVHLIPALRQAVAEVPLGLDHPRRFDDADLDLDQHFRHEVFLEPAGPDELAAFVGQFASEQLDRSRPLWEMVLVDGLTDGTVALVTKVHHCVADGDEAVNILMTMLDLEERHDVAPVVVGDEQPTERPNGHRLVVSAVADRLRHPLRPVGSSLGLARAGVALATAPLWAGRGASDVRGFGSTKGPFNGQLTARRSIAVGQIPLASLRRARRGAGGATVNDVLLAGVAGGVRTHLQSIGMSTSNPLVASVPVTVQREGEMSSVNQLSVMSLRLPIDQPMNLGRLRSVRNRTINAKRFHRIAGSGLASSLVETVPPVVLNALSHVSTSVVEPVAERAHNLVVSNIVGPPLPLWLGGARLVACHPFGPLTLGCGLSINAMSTNGSLDLGVMVCPDVVGNPQPILDAILGEIGRLAGEVDAVRNGVAEVIAL